MVVMLVKGVLLQTSADGLYAPGVSGGEWKATGCCYICDRSCLRIIGLQRKMSFGLTASMSPPVKKQVIFSKNCCNNFSTTGRVVTKKKKKKLN